MAPAIGVKRIVRKAKLKLDASAAAAGATSSSDGIARPVTRSEFQELVAGVSVLRKKLQQQICLEAQVGSELEVFGAQVASNKSALGKLAELLLDKTQHMNETITKQMQHLGVESDRRITDIQLAIERLEFRFKHHIRDCKSIADQVDIHRETLQTCKSQLCQTQIMLDKQVEQQKAFMETIDYSAKIAEERVKAVTSECTNSVESFQQRMIAFIKELEKSTQESVAVVVAQTRDLEVQGKRYKCLLHQHLDEQINMQQAVVDCEAKLSHLELYQNESRHRQGEDAARVDVLEGRIGKLLLLVERGAERCEVEQLVDRSERHLKTRIEAVLELVQLCIQTTKAV